MSKDEEYFCIIEIFRYVHAPLSVIEMLGTRHHLDTTEQKTTHLKAYPIPLKRKTCMKTLTSYGIRKKKDYAWRKVGLDWINRVKLPSHRDRMNNTF